MAGGTPEDPVFGVRALTLRARFETPIDGLLSQGSERDTLISLQGPLEPGPLARLRDLGLEPEPQPGGRQRLRLPLGALGALRVAGAEHADLAILLAARDNALRPRAPWMGARVMGVLNVTPDSFSDGGHHDDTHRAVQHGISLAQAGADLIDIGGESTRPGSDPVPLAEELRRVLPVVEALAREVLVPLSIDTTKAQVADAALERGASAVNDVSAGQADPGMLPVVARHRAHLVLMHMQGTPRRMQAAPHYDDVVLEVTEALRARAAAALAAGIPRERLSVDPGIGFGKDLEHNLTLLRRLGELRSLGLPIVLGVSRKSFLGRISGRRAAHDRDAETLAAVCLGAHLGADVHRVHDVAATRAALLVQDTILGSAALSPTPQSAGAAI